MIIRPYTRRVHFYETDQMHIVHHANYIHWMEEARIDYMEQMGFGYAKAEELGVNVAVVGIECVYKKPALFGTSVQVVCRIGNLTPVRMSVMYEIANTETGEVHATGESKHCYLNREGRPVQLKKVLPELYEMLCASMKEEV